MTMTTEPRAEFECPPPPERSRLEDVVVSVALFVPLNMWAVVLAGWWGTALMLATMVATLVYAAWKGRLR